MNKQKGTMEVMEQPVLTKRFDLAGNTVARVCRHQVRARLIPMGNYRGGAGFRCLLVFAVLHYLGGAMFQVLIRFERQLVFLYRMKGRMHERGLPQEGRSEKGGK